MLFSPVSSAGRAIVLPGKAMSGVLAWLRGRLPEEDLDEVDAFHTSVRIAIGYGVDCSEYCFAPFFRVPLLPRVQVVDHLKGGGAASTLAGLQGMLPAVRAIAVKGLAAEG